MLQTLPIKNHEVVDVGTGSGILAITAAKLGASSVVAVENDPDAASVARKNITDNGVNEICDPSMKKTSGHCLFSQRHS